MTISLEGLGDAVREAPPARRFRVDAVLNDFADDEVNRQILHDLVTDSSVPARRLSDELAKRGVSVSSAAITNWRRANSVQ